MFANDILILLCIITAAAIVGIYGIIKGKGLVQKAVSGCTVCFIIALVVIVLGCLEKEFLMLLFGFFIMIIDSSFLIYILKSVEEKQ